VVVADVEGSLDAATVERGATVLQALHPLLRVRVVEEGGRVMRRYHFRADSVPSPEVRMAPADTFSPDGLTREVEAELARHFAVERGPLFRLALASSPEPDRHRLLLTMHHMIADGASSSIVIRDLLDACAGRRGLSERPLFAPGPSFPGVGQVRALWRLAKLLGRTAVHLLTRRPVGRNVPGLNAPAAGRETGILFRDLDRSQTAALRAAARAEGTTVGGLLSAAIVRAVHATSAPGNVAHVALVNAVNVRDLASPGALERVDLLMSFVVTYHRVGGTRGFFDIARECSAEVKRAVARGDAVVPHTLAGLLPSIEPGEAVRATIRVADRFATTAALTNVGPVALPSSFGPLTLTSLTFAPSLGFLGRFSGVASTFDGRLSWNFAYVKQVVGRDLAERIAALSVGDLLAHTAPWLPSA
jgi:NRPS condensation-like uncharacterized protein